MTDDRPWKEAAIFARNQQRRIVCGPSGVNRDELAAEYRPVVACRQSELSTLPDAVESIADIDARRTTLRPKQRSEGTAHMYPGAHIATRAQQPAVIMAGSGEVVTYGALEARSNRLAHLMRARAAPVRSLRYLHGKQHALHRDLRRG